MKGTYPFKLKLAALILVATSTVIAISCNKEEAWAISWGA
jgi:hypothetical protein